MAKNNKVSMPTSTAGITRYFDETRSKLRIKPGHVIVICVIVALIILMLHTFGNAWLGLN